MADIYHIRFEVKIEHDPSMRDGIDYPESHVYVVADFNALADAFEQLPVISHAARAAGMSTSTALRFLRRNGLHPDQRDDVRPPFDEYAARLGAEAVEAVSTHESVGRAARALGVTKRTVFRRIRNARSRDLLPS